MPSTNQSYIMKKTFYLIAAAAAAVAAACNKTDVPAVDSAAPAEEGLRYELSVKIGSGARTRTVADTIDDEEVINTVQVFVFNGNALDAYLETDEPEEITLSCTAGVRDVYVVVNGCETISPAGITPSSLVASPAFLANYTLLNQQPANLFAFGSTHVEVPSSSEVVVNVHRNVSRVVINNVELDFAEPSAFPIATTTVTIDEVYLSKAAWSAPYPTGLATLADNWTGVKPVSTDGQSYLVWTNLLHDSVNRSMVVPGESEYEIYDTAHWFYCMPHLSSVETTSLVVEMTINGIKTYYPIALPDMEAEKSYEINCLKITRMGSSSPEIPVEIMDNSFQIAIEPWTVVYVNDGTII